MSIDKFNQGIFTYHYQIQNGVKVLHDAPYNILKRYDAVTCFQGYKTTMWKENILQTTYAIQLNNDAKYSQLSKE